MEDARRMPPKKSVERWVEELASEASFGAQNPVDPRLPRPTQLSPLLLISAVLFTQSLNEYVRSRPDRKVRLPPGTLAIMLANTLVFFKPGGVSSAAVCLAPRRIIEGREYSRVVKSAFVHLDLPHLTSNMRSVLECGTKMEEIVGPQALLSDVASLTLVSQGLHVVSSWAEDNLLGTGTAYHTGCSVGFSSTCFALQTLVGYLQDEDEIDPSSRVISPKFLCWVNLAISQIMLPSSSLQGHLCGIVAGLVRVFVPGPFLWLRRGITGLVARVCGRERYNERDELQMLGKRKVSDLLVHLGFGFVAVLVHMSKGTQQQNGREQT